ncbi:PorT family protein [Hymenobacter sp. 15J16-1T3B]|uniref:porin family protein n=1 Tax=Hymenobacter sp. 15J16-1T3B TaxID=2886941 RepID=UPI001D0FCD0F|nr:porin family protein [Hymenobacter sp. 15J16-1T3B]MCC3156625.1 PorT family protein [Hymenobacter sp. 15J16-1T3B]
MQNNRATLAIAFSAALLLGATAASAQDQRPAYSRTYVEAPSTHSAAPANKADGVRFGIRAGLNVADWSGDAVQGVQQLLDLTDGAVTRQQRPGFHAGAYVSLPLGPRFTLEPGVQYAEKGVVVTGKLPLEQLDFLNAKATATARMGYIDVPVLLKGYLTRGLYLYAGPQASYLATGKVRVAAGALGFTAFKQDFDVRRYFRSIDFGVTGGAGYQFANGLGLSAGYDYGLSSLDDSNRFDAQNRVVKASLNYTF